MFGSRLPRAFLWKRAILVRRGFCRLPPAMLSSVVAAGVSSLLWPDSAVTQEMGTLTGVVTAANAAPLPRARVTISGTLLATATDSTGKFRVARIPPGTSTLEIRMLGYAPLALPVEILAGETLHINLAMSSEAIVLGPVDVTADPVDPAMRGFQARRSRGTGRFFDREDILKMQPRVFTDVLRRVAGIQIQSGIEAYGSGSSVQIGRNSGGMGTRVCPVEYFVNGTPFPSGRDGGINHFIAPEEVVGVEVYAGTSQIPQVFSSAMYNTRCGVVVIWTRSGPEKRAPR